MSGPGWGQLHRHEYREIRRIGAVVFERCECGAARHFVDRRVP